MSVKPRIWRVIIGVATASSALSPAYAQSAPAGSVPTREELQQAAPTKSGPKAPRLRVEGDIERAPCPLADPKFQTITVDFRKAEFANLKGLTVADLQPAWAEYVGKTVSMATVCEIRDRAATILRRAGYLAAVQVPAQRIQDGVVYFDVLMARLEAVQVRGNAGASEKLIAQYLNKLTQQEVFNEKEAERYLLLARDLPGLDVRLRLKPAGTTPGAVIGEVLIESTPYSVQANIQNYGSRTVGRWSGVVRGEAYNIIGNGDKFYVGAYSTLQTDEQQVLQAGYDIHLGGEGLVLGGGYTHAWTKPDTNALPSAQIRSRSEIINLEARYPLLRRQSRNIVLAGGLDIINQKVRFGAVPLTQDHVRVAYLRTEASFMDAGSQFSTQGYSFSEPLWKITGSVEARKGLSILNASKSCGAPPSYSGCFTTGAVALSRIEADPTAMLVRFDMQAEYRPIPSLTLVFAPRAQISNKPLISYEEFSVGNFTTGRGYDAGTLLGDNGLGFRSEIKLGKIMPKSTKDLSFQPYAFLDQALVWNKRSPVPALQRRESLTSAGGGIRSAWGNHGIVDATVAVPLKDAGVLNRRGDVRFLVSFTAKLLPW